MLIHGQTRSLILILDPWSFLLLDPILDPCSLIRSLILEPWSDPWSLILWVLTCRPPGPTSRLDPWSLIRSLILDPWSLILDPWYMSLYVAICRYMSVYVLAQELVNNYFSVWEEQEFLTRCWGYCPKTTHFATQQHHVSKSHLNISFVSRMINIRRIRL